jgi:heat shock protein HslJ
MLALGLAWGAAPVAAGDSFPGPLPASFSVEVPPEDGVSSRAVLELYEGNAYVLRSSTRRESTGESTDYDDIGLWKLVLSDMGRQLVLRGGTEAPVVFLIESQDVVVPLGPGGEPRRMAGEVVRMKRAAGFRAIEPQLFLHGMYSYMADAGLFTECLTGWRMSVAMEEDNAALERAYLEARATPGGAMLVSLEGRIALRTGPDGGEPRRTLVPVRMGRAWPGETCETSATTQSDRPPMLIPLTRTRWSLDVSQLPAPAPEDRSAVRLEFSADRLSAHSGCNTGVGSYRLEGDTLVLAGAMATTRRACFGPVAAFEPVFFDLLGSRPTVQNDGGALLLESSQGSLRFRRVPMPSESAVQKFVYVAAERAPCVGVAPKQCLQVRDTPDQPWRLHYDEIVGFTPEPGIEYRLRILEDTVANPPADGSAKRWFLDLVVEQRVVRKE